MFINSNNFNIWKQSRGNKKEYAKTMRNRTKKANLVQEKERISNLKMMFLKGKITKEEFEEKMKL